MVRLAGLAIAWSQVRICLPTPTQRAVPGSVNENSYQRKLESKRAYHAMHWPCIRGLAASACVWLRARRNGDHLGMDLYTVCYLAPNVYWKFGITRFTSMRCTFQTTEAHTIYRPQHKQAYIYLESVGLTLNLNIVIIHTFIRTKGPLWPLTMLCKLKVIWSILLDFSDAHPTVELYSKHCSRSGAWHHCTI